MAIPEGPCLRLWRMHHPGYGLLSVRQQIFQRSGALRAQRRFRRSVVRGAQDLDELAFALGALAHYAADNNGHPIAVNRAVAMEYPKLRAQYGDDVCSSLNPPAHLKTEFGFDVAQVAQGNYAAAGYHDFIGFQVSKDLLERAFRDTYGLELKDQFVSLDLALGTYRRTFGTIIPEATKIAWSLKKKEIVQAQPGMTKRRFLYNLKGSSYEKEWGTEYNRPGVFARVMAFLFRIIPKVGPFKSVDFKASTPQTETLFMQSFNRTLDLYRTLLLQQQTQQTKGRLPLANTDFDTGRPTRDGEYSLADKTYAKLLRDLAKQGFKGVTPELRANLLSFYRNPKPPATGAKKARKPDEKDWPGHAGRAGAAAGAGDAGPQRCTGKPKMTCRQSSAPARPPSNDPLPRVRGFR